MFDNLMKEIQKVNSKANWANLAAGIALLVLMMGASVWYFSKNAVNSVNDESSKADTSTEKSMTSNSDSKDEKKETPSSDQQGATGTGGPVGGPAVEVLPNTSSK